MPFGKSVVLREGSRSWLGEKFEIFAVVSVIRVKGVQNCSERGKWVNALLSKINLDFKRIRASS